MSEHNNGMSVSMLILTETVTCTILIYQHAHRKGCCGGLEKTNAKRPTIKDKCKSKIKKNFAFGLTTINQIASLLMAQILSKKRRQHKTIAKTGNGL